MGLATRGESPSIHIMLRQTPRGILQHSGHLGNMDPYFRLLGAEEAIEGVDVRTSLDPEKYRAFSAKW